MRSTTAIAGALWLLAASPSEAAQGETALALELGPEIADGRGGGRLGVSAWFGVQRWVWLQAGASGNLTQDGRLGFEFQGGGVAALDVLRWVPWIELGAGLGRSGGRSGFLLRGSLGVDYLLGPNWALGGLLRGRGITGDDPQALGSMEFRVVRRFGF
ncbi:MAG: hypothetical protein AAF627_09045 [Myxococcota bacterium]